MKRSAVVTLVIGALFPGGCTYVPAIEPTDLSPVYQETATRADIEAVLGEPVASRATESGIVSVYRYNKGAAGGAETPLGTPNLALDEQVAAGLLVAPFIWAATPFLYSKKNRDQKGYLGVAYAAEGPPTIVELWGQAGPETMLDAAVNRLEDERRRRRREEGSNSAGAAPSG